MIQQSSQWGHGTLSILICVVCICAAFVHANPTPEEYRAKAHRISGSINIDGNLTENAWAQATPISQLCQVEPEEGEPGTQPTEIKVLYDDEHVYFGFTCLDADITQLIANEMRRDAGGIHDNDNVYVMLDTYNDHRSGFFFRVNALGAMQDTAVTNGGDSMNRDWNAVWTCRSQIHEDGWTSELAIPFSQLRFNQSDEMEWGLNMGRENPRNQETTIWFPSSKSFGGRAKYRTANMGVLEGLSGIQPGRHLELLPYITPGISHSTEDDEEKTDTVFDLGLDAKYGITANFTADLTFNTDFAQVEADQERVNLTRFSLFLPEKRPFFLEGAGLFDFGIPRASFFRPPPLLLFYSRRIGLEEGHAIPILAGGKITGKMGRYGVGLLNVLTDEFHFDDDEESLDVLRTNYSVLRLKRDVLAQSSVGLIAVNQQNTDTYNRAGGIDFSYRPTEDLDMKGMWARTFEEDAIGPRNAWYLGSNWRHDDLRLEGSYMQIGENFSPGMGFVRRTGIRQMRAEMRYSPWPERFHIRRIFLGPEVDFTLNQENELEARDISYSNWFELDNGWGFDVRGQHSFERLDEDFEIRDGIIIPSGKYSFGSIGGFISSDDTKRLTGDMRMNIGNFFDGTRRSVGLGLEFKPSSRLGLQADYQFNHVELPAGSFSANVLSTRLVYSFSTSLFAKLYTQWNSEREVIGANFLLNYIYRPGSDFFLVLNQDYNLEENNMGIASSALVVKFTYWWNP